MELSPGTRLGRYELLGPLGKGGMGEVYRARDERLGREVAIKVLPPAFAKDGDRIARFEREARLLAALNHPGIAAIYEVGEQDGRHYLVLELVPGETLAERLRTGPVAMEEALHFARQVAEALEAAHGQGIVHRDLKPANVKLTPAGKLKLLDFGLAKDVAVSAAQSDVTSSPTRSMGATEAGVVLGTVDYMSPEQARGRSIDKRTDVWAFGCLLYELLTRRPAFAGETASDVIARVLTRDPDWELLPAGTPSSVVSLLRRCLQRDLERRMRDVGDARLEIEEALTAPVAVAGSPVSAKLPRPRAAVLGGLVLLAGVSMAVALSGWMRRPPVAQRPIVRFPLVLLPGAYVNSVEFSPDGSRLAFDLGVPDPQPSRKLFLRRLDQLEATLIPGTDGGISPIFSPDGQWLAFRQSEGKAEALMKVPLTGGAAAKVCTIQNFASWADDDSIYFTSPSASGIWRVSAAGGTPQRLTTPQAGERDHASARALPGGQAVLFTIAYTNKPDNIAVFSPKTGTRVLVEGAREARFVPTGHLLYMQARALMAARFDPARLELSPPAVQLLEGVEHFSVAANGSLAYVPSSRQEAEHALLVVDRNGKPRSLTDKRRAFEGPRFSPDGGRIAVTIRAPQTPGVWIYDIRQDTLTPLTLEGSSRWPIWTPDGQRVTYVAGRDGRRLLVSRPADQSGAEEELFAAGDIDAPTSWSPDGRTLLFNRYPPEAGVWMLSLEGGDKAAKRFEPATLHWADAVVSPNGQWIAYASNESGERHVFVQPLSGKGAKRQVSIEGGALPCWRRDGKELFFLHGDDLMVAAVTIDGRFEAGRPRLLFKAPYWHTANVRNYDVAPDGQSFVMGKRERRFPPSEVVVVLNWTDELKRLVRAGN